MNNTKQAIHTAFISLYRKHSFNQISVKELCIQTPVARTTFYSYYNNLAELKNEIEDELIEGILEIAKHSIDDSPDKADMTSFFSKTLSYIKLHWDENYAFLIAQPNLSYITKWKDAIKYHLALRFPGRETMANYGLIFEVIASAIIGAYTYWMEHPDEVDIPQFTDISIQMLLATGQIL